MAISVDEFIVSWTETIQHHIRNKRVCLVVDPGAQKAYEIHQQLERLGVARDIGRFESFTANPTWTALTEGFASAQSVGAECIVAVGGGTALDLAKLIATAMEIGDPASMWDQHIEGSIQQIARTQHSLIGIPTTAGTGAETTPFAVVYRDGIKHSIAGPALQPDQSILDSTLLEKLPRAVLIDSGLDAACQAMESIWSRRSNPESEQSAWSALELIVHHFPRVVESPTPNHLAAMLVASHLAGRAISITTTTAPHALSYGLTSKYGIPHGRAVAMLFGSVYETTRNAPTSAFSNPTAKSEATDRLRKIARIWGQEADGFADWWNSNLNETFGILFRIHEMDAADIEQLTEGVNQTRLSNHPCQFSSSQIRNLYAGLTNRLRP